MLIQPRALDRRYCLQAAQRVVYDASAARAWSFVSGACIAAFWYLRARVKQKAVRCDGDLLVRDQAVRGGTAAASFSAYLSCYQSSARSSDMGLHTVPPGGAVSSSTKTVPLAAET
jgi:peptidoglycan/LPS O-acetylase OafA/YrhL